MGFADALDSSLIDYSSDFEKNDTDHKKRCDIEKWLKTHAVKETIGYIISPLSFNSAFEIKYEINKDFTIDVFSACYIINYVEEELPEYIQFNIANSHFSVANLKLKTLKGCPKIVKGEFSCHNNEIKNLIGGPEKVELTYYCQNKYLTSLEGSPEYVSRFNFTNCPRLKDLNYLPFAETYIYNGYIYDKSEIEKLKKKFNNNTN